MEHPKPASEQGLRDFLRQEFPRGTADFEESVVADVAFARARYSRYAEARRVKRHAFTYVSKRRACRRLVGLTELLAKELGEADLMVLDELDSLFGGDDGFRTDLIGRLDRLNNASNELQETLPRGGTQRGRPEDRIFYDWVLSMVRIYEELFGRLEKTSPKKGRNDLGEKGRFMVFLRCWLPDNVPDLRSRLQPRTIKKILEFRDNSEDELRSRLFSRAKARPPVI